MEKGNRIPWDVTRLRPVPPLQFYHSINEKTICVTKRRKFKFLKKVNLIVKFKCIK